MEELEEKVQSWTKGSKEVSLGRDGRMRGGERRAGGGRGGGQRDRCLKKEGKRWMAVEQRRIHQSLFLQREFILREKQALALS